MAQITRSILRQEVRTAVLDRLITGKLPPGERINETWLARELGVSPTPVREALLTLDGSRFLHSMAGKGFVVAPLDVQEMKDIFSVNAALDAMALRLSGPFDDARIQRLRAINDDFRSKSTAKGADQADVRFHAELVSTCPNRHLLELIRTGRQAGQRYEYAFLDKVMEKEASADQHEQIIGALALGDMDEAVEALHANWKRTMDVLAECLSS